LGRSSIAELTFRAAVRKDIPDLVALDHICFPEELAYDGRVFEDILDWRGSWHIVALHGERVVGFVAAVPYDRFAHFITLDIHPDFRRMGLGNMLMDAAERMIAEDGFKIAVLEVESDNEAAIALYKKRGYTIRGMLKGYYANGKDAYVMSKVLSDYGDGL